MKQFRICLAFLVVALLTGTAKAQNTVERDPGYIDLADIESWFGSEATLEVNIKGALLKLVSEASRHEDPELADLLTNLKAIQVRGYTLTPSQLQGINQRTAELGRRLARSGWDTVARVREDGEDIHMYVKATDDAIAGLVVMVVSPGENETMFVNIVGDINPEEIGRIGRKFDIGPLERRGNN